MSGEVLGSQLNNIQRETRAEARVWFWAFLTTPIVANSTGGIAARELVNYLTSETLTY